MQQIYFKYIHKIINNENKSCLTFAKLIANMFCKHFDELIYSIDLVEVYYQAVFSCFSTTTHSRLLCAAERGVGL